MRCYQRKYCRRKCLCCKNCSKCQEFTKVIAGNNFDIYIYVNHSKDNTNGDGMAGNNGFVFTNMHDTPININDLLRTIELNELNCQRCKYILIRVSNIVTELIQENKVVVICASCVSRCISDRLCKFCHRIYDNFISNKKLHGTTTKAYANKWTSAIGHLLSNKREAKKILPFEEEPPKIITAVSHSSLEIAEVNVNVNLSGALNLKLKSDPKVITKDLSYLSQPHVDETKAPEKINKIVKKHKTLEGFVYVFPKKDLERYDLKKRISSNLLIKEIQEKVIKDGRDDIPNDIKAAEIKNMKVKTFKSNGAYVDVKKSPSTNKDKMPKKRLKVKGETEVYNPERIKNQKEDIDIKDNSETVPRVKRKVNKKTHKQKDTQSIVNGTNAFETVKNGDESGDGFLNLSKIISKNKNKEEKQKLSNRKRKTLKGSKSLINDPVHRLIKVDQHRSIVVRHGKQKSGKSVLEINKRKKTPVFKKNDKFASTVDLKLSRVKIRNASVDNFHVDMMKVKQSVFAREKPKKPKHLSDLKLSPLIIQQHKNHQSRKMSSCLICTDSELEIDIDELFKKDKLLEVTEIIIGRKIVKNRKPRFDKTDKNNIRPILFESTLERFDTEEVVQDHSCQRKNKISSALERQSQSLKKFVS